MRLSVATLLCLALSLALFTAPVRAEVTTLLSSTHASASRLSAPELSASSISALKMAPLVTLEEPGEVVLGPTESEHGAWLHVGGGLAFATKAREYRSGGLDGALGMAYAWRTLRAGVEFRFTAVGGFDEACEIWCYRVDVGPLHSVVLVQRESFVLSAGTRSMFSRAGTRRVERRGGSWDCRGDHCEKVGEAFHAIPYRVFYGFSATADLMLEWRGYFLRASFIRTRWLWDHGMRAPKHQDWVQVSFGVSGKQTR